MVVSVLGIYVIKYRIQILCISISLFVLIYFSKLYCVDIIAAFLVCHHNTMTKEANEKYSHNLLFEQI